MPVTPSYPGVYVEEIPSGVRTITGVSTSITAFIGVANRGPTDKAVRIFSFSDYESTFGGLEESSMMSYAVQHFFLNGGGEALIVRIVKGDAAASKIDLGGLKLRAANKGDWGNSLRAITDFQTQDQMLDKEGENRQFNLTIQEVEKKKTLAGEKIKVLRSESFKNLPHPGKYTDENKKKAREQLARALGNSLLVRFDSGDLVTEQEEPFIATENSGSNGLAVEPSDAMDGLDHLKRVDLFNILCIPPLQREPEDFDATKWGDLLTSAITLCENERAILIVDPLADWTDAKTALEKSEDGDFLRSKNSVCYFPSVKISDPLRDGTLQEFAPCGVMAGVIARTDVTRGVWKAPAGLDDGKLRGVQELAAPMSNEENGKLNQLGINCLRSFPVVGNVAWGARTLMGADLLASEWKYLPVRRLALYLEESLYRGTQWAVFEPNDEPLWAQLRLNIGAFMQNLFRQGAFQGQSPKEAYFVKVDKETTTQNDINLGIVNIVVGFAPLKPAEFVVLKFQQMTGQIDT